MSRVDIRDRDLMRGSIAQVIRKHYQKLSTDVFSCDLMRAAFRPSRSTG